MLFKIIIESIFSKKSEYCGFGEHISSSETSCACEKELHIGGTDECNRNKYEVVSRMLTYFSRPKSVRKIMKINENLKISNWVTISLRYVAMETVRKFENFPFSEHLISYILMFKNNMNLEVLV